jgi:hypothetical protein
MAQIRDLYADEALIGRSSGRVHYLVWVGAAALYFVVSYPFQGVVYSWCGDFVQIAFVVACGVSAFALQAQRRGEPPQYSVAAKIAVGALALAMLVTLAAHGNPTVIREMLLLAVIAVAWRATIKANLEPVRALIYVTVAALVPAFVVSAMFYAHWIDWPTWSVDHLNLADSNPLKIRQNWGDFNYYLPLWVAVVPNAFDVADQGLGLSFIRQSFLYTEPSDVWFYGAGLFWIAVADVKMPARALCLVVLGIALALSFSVFGILVTAAALMLALAMALGGRGAVLLLAVATLAALPFVPLDKLVRLLGSNKADQINFYTQNLQVFGDLTWLGHGASPDEQPLSYGFLVILYRYGIVGFAVSLGVTAAIVWASIRLLSDAATLGWRRFPLFIACFVSVALLIKDTGIVPTMPAICLAAALGFRQARLHPLAKIR